MTRSGVDVLKGHGLTGCGKTRSKHKSTGPCNRARLQSGRKSTNINAGLSPCKTPRPHRVQTRPFFRSLFSRAESALIRSLALAVKFPNLHAPAPARVDRLRRLVHVHPHCRHPAPVDPRSLGRGNRQIQNPAMSLAITRTDVKSQPSPIAENYRILAQNADMDLLHPCASKSVRSARFSRQKLKGGYPPSKPGQEWSLPQGNANKMNNMGNNASYSSVNLRTRFLAVFLAKKRPLCLKASPLFGAEKREASRMEKPQSIQFEVRSRERITSAPSARLAIRLSQPDSPSRSGTPSGRSRPAVCQPSAA